MLLQDSRRAARVDAAASLVTLEEQDRSSWDQATIEEACTVLDRAVRLRRPGPYQLLAAIAACHAQAPTAADTDWREIAVLYDRLSELVALPRSVLLNRAVAVAMDARTGGRAGTRRRTRPSAGALADYYLLPATRADLLRRLAATRRPRRRTAARWSSRRPTPSGDSYGGDLPRCRKSLTAEVSI